MILYTDKPYVFECGLDVKGTSMQNTQARIVLEGSRWNLIFYGSIDKNGHCTIDIDKLPIFNEGEEGKVRLEVIAEESYFPAWEDEFTVQKSKKVTVEIFDRSTVSTPTSKSTKIVVVNAPSKQKDDTLDLVNRFADAGPGINEAVTRLKSSKITQNNFSEKGDMFASIIAEIVQKHNIQSEERKSFMKRILDFLPS